jgi:hypothetical protein
VSVAEWFEDEPKSKRFSNRLRTRQNIVGSARVWW